MLGVSGMLRRLVFACVFISCLSLVLVAVLFALESRHSGRIAEIAETTCAGQNEIRAINAEIIQAEMDRLVEQLESGQLERLLPGSPPDELRAVIEEQNVERQEQIDRLAPIPCDPEVRDVVVAP